MILITGGTGKTGRRVARLVGDRAIVASRRAGVGQVLFDWRDPATYGDALAGVKAVYLVAPSDTLEPLPAMQPFLERALSEGVTRFVLLSASILEEGGPMMGQVHAYLKERAPRWIVLRPSWFMQNFTEQQHEATIREDQAIYSATGNGRVAFIDGEDIAAVAARALCDAEFPSGDLVLTGPEALSYDDVARIVSEQSGRTIEHRRLDEEQLASHFVASLDLPAEYASALAKMDTLIASGVEDRTTAHVAAVLGRQPRDFRQFYASQMAQLGT